MPGALIERTVPRFAEVDLALPSPTASEPRPNSEPVPAAPVRADIDPMAWLTDVLERLISGRTKVNQLHTLLPWNWQAQADTTVTNAPNARAA